MADISDITKAFDAFIDAWAKFNQIYSMQGVVTSVNKEKRVCSVDIGDDGFVINNVYLEADYQSENSESKGFFVVPTVGSNVIITFLDETTAYVAVWTEVDEIVAKQGTFTFNDGSNGGMAIVSKIVERLNNIENKFNQHLHISPAGPTATPINAAQQPLLITPITKDSDIENKNVKH